MRSLLLASLAGVLAAALAGCPKSDDAAPAPPTCTGQQALSAAPVFGSSIAAKTLALSFDDGPASRTGELSTYLKSQGIRATFFVNHRDDQDPAWFNVLPQLVADGHVIGNHTKTHPNLAEMVDAGNAAATIIAELTDVDTLISPYVPNNRYLFRAPFGAWDVNVYDVLKNSAMNKYVGHVEWEIGDDYIPPNDAADVACWQTYNRTSKDCGDLYIADIKDKGKGIVLMHDADYGDVANTNVNAGKGNTIDMVKYIVPLLKADGWQFVGVDQIPDIAAVLPPLPVDGGAEGGPDGGASSSGGSSTSSSSGAASSSSTSSGSTNPNPCP